MNSNFERIVALLADGRFHSGEAIAEQLGVSRAAVWKHLQKLADYGLQVNAVTGKGYRLPAEIELLNKSMLSGFLSREAAAWLSGMKLSLVTDSTNDDARSGLQSQSANLYLAEYQRAGRGRQGRVWLGGFAETVAMSVVWRFEQGAAALAGMSLCVGLAIVQALRQLGIEGVELKWPNDIYWQGRKLGGVLVELVGELSGAVTTVIGIGLNVRLNAEKNQIDQPWVDLAEIASVDVSRNRLVAEIVNAMNQVLPRFSQQGFGVFVPAWQQVDWLQGKPVSVCAGERSWAGEAQGVQADGALLVSISGQLKPFYGGEVSVRVSV